MRFLLDDARVHGVDVALDAVDALHGTTPVELRALPAPGRRGAEHVVYADRNGLRADLRRLIDAAGRGFIARHPHPGVMPDVGPATKPAGIIPGPGPGGGKAPPTPGRPWHGAWLLRAPNRAGLAPVAVLERLAATAHCADRQ